MPWVTDASGKRVWQPEGDDPGAPRTQLRDLPDGRTVLIDMNTGEIITDYGSAAASNAARKYSGSGLPAGYVQGSDGIVYVQDVERGVRGGQRSTLRPATPQEIAALNAPKPRAAPAPRAPTPPQTFTDRNGDVVGVNAFTGAEVYRIKGAQYAQISPQEQERIRQGDLAAARQYGTVERLAGQEWDAAQAAAGRTFATGENAADRVFRTGERVAGETFAAGENATNRAASSAESALGRALNAGQFAATLAQGRARDEMTADINYQQALRQYAQDRIAGAETVARLTNSTDPTALPAFYAAGGGNIGNAIASGASAVSDRAVLGAAQALRGNAERAAPTRFAVDYSGVNFDPSAYSQPAWTPPPAAPVPAPAAAAAVTTPSVTAAPPPSNPAANVGVAAPGALTTDQLNAMIRAQSPAGTAGARRFAFGTMGEPATGTFITGDSEHPTDPAAGGAQPEQITLEDPPGPDNAQAHVLPLTPPGGEEGGTAKFGAVLRAIGDMLIASGGGSSGAPPLGGPPRFAYGTDPFLHVAAGDEPFMQQIRDIRETSPYPLLNPRSTKYNFESPTMRESYELGVQGRYGAPVIDQQQEQRRYAVPTTYRGAFSLGV